MFRRAQRPATAILASLLLLVLAAAAVLRAAAGVQTPEQFIGFRVGTDNRLARWDTIVAYLKAVAAGSERVRVRELGRTQADNPLLLVEVSAADTQKNLDRYKQ